MRKRRREEYRSPEGRFPTAIDLADRLLPDLDVNELLLWSPNLFAYTSYILSLTGAYQLVISPPSGKSWTPKSDELNKWLSPQSAKNNLEKWMKDIVEVWHSSASFDISAKVNEIIQEIEETLDRKIEIKKNGLKEIVTLKKLIDDNDDLTWIKLVEVVGTNWKDKMFGISNEDLQLIDDVKTISPEDREQKLFNIIFERTPAILLACWAFFYNEVTDADFYKVSDANKMPLKLSDLLCNEGNEGNEEKTTLSKEQVERVWIVAQMIITMHAISDIACVKWGFQSVTDEKMNAQKYAEEELLFKKGTLSTINPERCRVLPKRHNPTIGITLRSISSNLAFHRSSVEVVWRKSSKNKLTERLMEDSQKKSMSILLLPYPLSVKAKHFSEYTSEFVKPAEGYGFFTYEPAKATKGFLDQIMDLINKASEETGESIDMIIMPESSLNSSDESSLEDRLKSVEQTPPSVYIAGFRETRAEIAKRKNKKEKEISFPRNAVYCKYYNEENGYGKDNSDNKYNYTPKYKQYKHHRWKLDESQIRQYGLSQVLDRKTNWWEAIKIPRRRVSFLNLGDKLTICHLICEDLARQDPIADLIRQAGPSLVVTILMDGPQKSDRWSSRYASVLSEDPGSSVITLTSYGMMKRWNSPYKQMSKVVALWSESHSYTREIVLEEGAKAILLTLDVDEKKEITADGRQETESTAVLRLVDVIQIYLDDEK